MYQRRTININRVVKLLQGAARSGASIPDLLDQCDIPRQLLDDERLVRLYEHGEISVLSVADLTTVALEQIGTLQAA